MDDHNAKRHAPISVKDVFSVRKWSTRHFVFLVALTKVNVKLGLMRFSDDENIAMVKFQEKVARALIFKKLVHTRADV